MTESSRKILAKFLRSAVYPLATFCLNRGLKIQEFEEAAKAAFIDAASKQLEKQNTEVSHSKLSVMIGLHRRDVARITANPETDKSQGLMMMRLLGQWQQDKRFCLKRGVGRPLTFEGVSSEFVELVQTVSKDLNPYTILFELERLKAVQKRGDRLELILDTLETREDLSEGLRVLGQDITSLVSAVEQNLYTEAEPANLHARTSYNRIDKTKLVEIKNWLLAEGAALHEKTRYFLARYDADVNPEVDPSKADAEVILTSFSRVIETAQKDPQSKQVSTNKKAKKT